MSIDIENLTNEVKYVKGVGPTKSELLNKVKIHTVKDLITYYPREYEDRSKTKYISELIDGEEALIEGIAYTRCVEIYANRKKMYKLTVKDETGTCYITWFNQSYLKTAFTAGKKYKFYGKVSIKSGRIEMNSPIFEDAEKSKNTSRIVPIYPLTYNLSQNTLRQIMENAISMLEGNLNETLPEYIIKKHNLLGINESIKQIHFPQNFESFKKAHKRLAFEELLSMQLALLLLKNNNTSQKKGIAFNKNVKMTDIINDLPFKLTKAQLRVLEEIDNDMEKETPMNRLLQGDVGSGKTIVAIIAAYKAVRAGYQMAIMAPTSILAVQHMENFQNTLEKYGIKCELLIGNTTKKNKEIITEKLKNGEIDVLVGTHSLLEENVEFKNLGLVITDEQHRFGVRQRGILSSKGENPDVLVMSATPIPRTLGLILYGDLDISIIDELPSNRKTIETYAVTKGMEERVNNFIKKQVDQGRQAYIVCPLVEENEELDLKSVTELYEKYKTEVFANYRLEYLHGKMRPKEKDEIMEKFKRKEIDILISTTVIEVGINVPNASVMVIENSERFGLAQLHQLRGRVGRGEYQSYCILKYESKGKVVQERMKIMSETNDGFKISEKDLELRGSGDFFGTEQHGIPEFKIANLFEDMPILKEVQVLATKVLKDDPKLEKEENYLLKQMSKNKLGDRIEI